MLELPERRHQRLGHESPAVGAKVASHIGHGSNGLRGHKPRYAKGNPGLLQTSFDVAGRVRLVCSPTMVRRRSGNGLVLITEAQRALVASTIAGNLTQVPARAELQAALATRAVDGRTGGIRRVVIHYSRTVACCIAGLDGTPEWALTRTRCRSVTARPTVFIDWGDAHT